jgi:hypothetical protein
VLSRAVEHGAMKDSAALMTKVPDYSLDYILEESRRERQRIQAEASRELPMSSAG